MMRRVLTAAVAVAVTVVMAGCGDSKPSPAGPVAPGGGQQGAPLKAAPTGPAPPKSVD